MKRCRGCGHQNGSDAKFCIACGRKFNPNKRLYIILGSIAACLTVIAVLTFVVLGQSVRKKEIREQAEEVVAAFTFGEIYEINEYLFDDGQKTELLSEGEVPASAARVDRDIALEKYFLYVTLEVGAVDGETVTYHVTAPDMSGFFESCMERPEEYQKEGIAGYFLAFAGQAPTAEKDVTLDYTYENSVFKADYTSENFTDAVMGGLVQGYQECLKEYGDNAVDKVISCKEGVKDETEAETDTEAESDKFKVKGTEAEATAAGEEKTAEEAESKGETAAAAKENAAPTEEMAPKATEAAPLPETVDSGIDPAYAEILEKYKSGVSKGWGIQEFAAAGLCYLFGYYSDTSQAGYALMDINNDGVEELILGESGLPDSYIGMFYELYTINAGQLTLVASSQERSRYYLCAGNEIAHEGSGGAFNSFSSYYNLKGGGLSMIEAVVYDGMYDQENPWFYCITGLTEEDYTPITEGEADRIRQSHEYADITFTPLSEFEN